MSDDALVTPGTLTVALDTSDAPQAMQDADGNLTGYAVDAARALACRYTIRALRGISGCSHQLTWYLTPHLRTGAFAREAAATFTTGPLAREAVLPQRK